MNAVAKPVADRHVERAPDRRARLIVNADDFGFYATVSDGILDACRAGRVTATGVFANGPALRTHLDALLALEHVTPGVHLNLTLGVPTTGYMRRRFGGRFPSKLRLFAQLAAGRLPIGAVGGEWHAQIRRLLRAGVRPWFVNSHEHVHAWPALTRLTEQLAREFSIPHVRQVAPEWRAAGGSALLRNLALRAIAGPARRAIGGAPPIALLGLAVSGRLDRHYTARRFAQVEPGGSYELLCHPGRAWPDAPARLRRYHAWQQELAFLCGPDFGRLLADHDLRLVSHADLAAEKIA